MKLLLWIINEDVLWNYFVLSSSLIEKSLDKVSHSKKYLKNPLPQHTISWNTKKESKKQKQKKAKIWKAKPKEIWWENINGKQKWKTTIKGKKKSWHKQKEPNNDFRIDKKKI